MKRKKFLTALLSAAMMLTAIAPGTAFADELPMNSYTAAGQGSVICQASVDANFLVKLPVAVTLNNDQAFSMPVQVSGDLVKGDTVTVTPAASVTMEYMTADTDHKKQSIVGTVSAGKTEFPFEELFNGNVVKDASTTVMISGLTAGTWQGQLGYEINLNKNGGKKTESAGLYTPSNTFVAWDDLMSEGKIVVTENKITSADKSLSGRLNISDEIENIGDNSLSQTPGLTDVTIPDTVTSIGDSAFKGDTGLTTIKVPDSVTSIGNGAFKDCTNLKYAKLPDKLTDIPNNVFEGDSTLAKDNIIYNGTASGKPWGATGTTDSTGGSTSGSDSKKDDTGDVQTQAAGLYGVNENGELDGSFTSWDELVNDGYFTIDSRKRIETNSEFKALLKGKLVLPEESSFTSLKSSAFENCKELTEVVLPDTITEINYYAFRGCEKLKKVNVSENITYYAGQIFNECPSLTEAYIPSCVTELDDFSGCTSLTTLNIPSSVETIKRSAFSNSGLTSIDIPSNVTEIKDGAFSGCTELETVTFHEGLDTIGRGAFRGCSKLVSINIPASVTSIAMSGGASLGGMPSFEGCSNLSSITVDAENKVYDSRDNCNAIIGTSDNYLICGCKNTVIPDSVNAIMGYAFADCKDLTTITIPNNVKRIDEGVFYGCTNLVSVTLPNKLENIANKCFEGCKSLTSITIPNTVTEIYDLAFSNSGLTTVVIPNSVNNIQSEAFYMCGALVSVVLPNEATYISEGIFNDCPNLTTIYYSGSLTSDTNWGATNATIKANNTAA